MSACRTCMGGLRFDDRPRLISRSFSASSATDRSIWPVCLSPPQRHLEEKSARRDCLAIPSMRKDGVIADFYLRDEPDQYAPAPHG